MNLQQIVGHIAAYYHNLKEHLEKHDDRDELVWLKDEEGLHWVDGHDVLNAMDDFLTVMETKDHVVEINTESDPEADKKLVSNTSTPFMVEKIIQLYNDGYNQKQVANLINEYTKAENIKTKGKLYQTGVCEVLKKHNVKTRAFSPTPKLSQDKIDQIRQLRLQGLSLNKIAARLNVSAASVYVYSHDVIKCQTQS